ncbi:MAG: hypothetical protein NC112_08680 [Oxalobacter formigenes]|nr:hypothetical protein [Oxalobacter formigenes]
MKHFLLDKMVRGWFVGDFSPCAVSTEACEVAVKRYKAGESEDAHYHKIATEVTLILRGKVRMADKDWGSGDIVILEPGEKSAFYALTEAEVVVVKLPSVKGDKYLCQVP